MAYRILVADDEAEIRDVIRLYLEKEGYEVAEAADGAEAVRQIKSGTIDLAILDIMMPGLNGYRVLQNIREENNLPVLMLSAKNSDSDKILGLDLGADDYITKPFVPLEMVARVRRIFGDSMHWEQETAERIPTALFWWEVCGWNWIPACCIGRRSGSS